MNDKTTSSAPRPMRSRNPTLRRIRIGLVLLIVAYIFAQPWLEKQFGWSLPSLARNEDPSATVDQPTQESLDRVDERESSRTGSQESISSGGQLREIRRDVFESPAGLIYTPGSQQGHRLKHVMAHARDEPNRPGPHGVFRDASQEGVVALIDEAYRASLKGNADRSGSDSERQVWTVDMGRDIGYVGGQVGRQRGHPTCDQLRIVLDGNRVITAYPVQQRKRR